MDKINGIHTCTICSKVYKTYKSLWNHNKIFHSNIVNISNTIIPILKNNYFCNYCNREFINRQNRWKHEKICVKKEIIKNNENKLLEIELEKIKLLKEEKEIELAKIKLLKEEKEIEKLKLKIKLKKTNRSNKIINNNNKIINNNNNITINNMGDERVCNLSLSDIKILAQKGSNALTYIIEQLNFNKKHPENYIFCTTSLEGDYVSVYNKNTNSINKEIKKEYHDKLLLNSIRKIDEILFLTEFDENYIIDEKYIKMLEKVVTAYDIHFKNNKKAFASTINQLSYNNNKNILDIWKKIPNVIKDIDDFNNDDI